MLPNPDVLVRKEDALASQREIPSLLSSPRKKSSEGDRPYVGDGCEESLYCRGIFLSARGEPVATAIALVDGPPVAGLQHFINFLKVYRSLFSRRRIRAMHFV